MLGAFLGAAQVDSLDVDLIPWGTDSIHLAVWEVYHKEGALPGQEEMEYELELYRVSLSQQDQELLLNRLKNPKSYDQTRALPYHYNLVFSIYKGMLLSGEVRISTLTGNIDIDNQLSGSSFKNNCSGEMGKVIIEFLEKYDLLQFFDEVLLEGMKN